MFFFRRTTSERTFSKMFKNTNLKLESRLNTRIRIRNQKLESGNSSKCGTGFETCRRVRHISADSYSELSNKRNGQRSVFQPPPQHF
jgi:hypothetical protein